MTTSAPDTYLYTPFEMPLTTLPQKADDFLLLAAKTLRDRAVLRDVGEERSMKRCVKMFNAMKGTDLSERDGWNFMVLLKLARAYSGTPQLDDALDGTAYSALSAEALAKEATEP